MLWCGVVIVWGKKKHGPGGWCGRACDVVFSSKSVPSWQQPPFTNTPTNHPPHKHKHTTASLSPFIMSVVRRPCRQFLTLATTTLLLSSNLASAFLLPSRAPIASSSILRRQAYAKGRPSLDDVERLSHGQAAKKRGTGSRNICHRLNEMERKEFDLAKKMGFVQLRGAYIVVVLWVAGF